MIINANSCEEVPTQLDSDIVVVGAGTVGLFFASYFLSLVPSARLILVESGGRCIDTSNNIKNSVTVGKPHYGTQHGRASGIGGTSGLWGGQLAEFEPYDFERSDAPWPVSYAEVHPYYREVYRHLGIKSMLTDPEYRMKFGCEEVSDGPLERFFTHWLKEPNLGHFFQNLIHDKRLKIVINLTVNDIGFQDEDAKYIAGNSANGRLIKFNCKKFIFCSGTIPTVRFFLTMARFRDVPWKDNPNLGMFFQDHMAGKVASVTLLDDRKFRQYFENGWVDGVKVQPKMRFSPRYRVDMNSGVCLFFSFDSELSDNIANIKMFVRNFKSNLNYTTTLSLFKDCVRVGRVLFPLVTKYLINRRVLAIFDRGISLIAQLEQVPTNASRISIFEEYVLPDGLCKVEINWQIRGSEISAVRTAAKLADEYLRSKGIAKLEINRDLTNLKPEFMHNLSDTYHQCGGMRMSDRVDTGVVDSDCRVWGTNNVWVVGSVVYPSSSHANSTLTGLALAARLASKIAEYNPDKSWQEVDE